MKKLVTLLFLSAFVHFKILITKRHYFMLTSDNTKRVQEIIDTIKTVCEVHKDLLIDKN